MSEVNHFFIGDYANEDDGKKHLVSILDKFQDLFAVFPEVPGFCRQPRTGQDRSPRIDFILCPRQPLIDAGWSCGDIGIECKAPGKKLGVAVAQVLDYSRCTFRLPSGRDSWLDQIFVWRIPKIAGCVESIMMQHRIGWIKSDNYCPLKFKMGVTNWIEAYEADHTTKDRVKVNSKLSNNTGRRFGSR